MSKASKHIFTFVLISIVGAILNFATLSLKLPEQLAQALVLYIFGSAVFAIGVIGAVWYIRAWCRYGPDLDENAAAIAVADAEASFVKTLPCEYPPSLPQMYQHASAPASAPVPSWVAQGSYVYPVLQK